MEPVLTVIYSYVYIHTVYTYQPGGPAPPKGHKIHLGGCEGRKEEKVLIHKSVFIFQPTQKLKHDKGPQLHKVFL